MSAPSRDDRAARTVAPADSIGRTKADTRSDRGEPVDWVQALSTPGPEQAVAMRQLHDLMLRAAGHQVARMRGALPDDSPATVDVIVNQAADEAMTALLGKLHTFEGRSRFTTWAFKFAILQAATDVRRVQWQHREVELRDLDLATKPGPHHESPENHTEGVDLAAAVAASMHAVLTPHQRRVAVALLVDGVPIDVLAERLGATRGALYKTVHDVRGRLRADLVSKGYLRAEPTRAGSSLTTATPTTTGLS